MIWLFSLLSSFSFFYFFLRKRQFDFFSLSFLGVMIYFHPLFFGESYLNVSFFDQAIYTIQPEIYACVSFLLLVVDVFAWLYDTKYGARQVDLKYLVSREKTKINLFLGLTFFISLATLLLLYRKLASAGLLDQGDKHVIMSVLGVEMNYFVVSILIGYTVSLLAKKRVVTLAFLALSFFHVYLQFRSLLFGVIVISVVFFFYNKRERWAIKYWYLGFVAVFLLFLLYIVKPLLVMFKEGKADFGRIFSYLDHKFFNQFLFLFTRQSEPQIIVSSFVESINHHVSLDIDYFTSNIINLVPFARSLFGVEVERYNQFIQPLFPFFSGGIAANFLAEAYSLSPLWMIFLIVLWGGSAYFANWFFFRSMHGLLMKAFFLLNAPYMTIYIYRNDMSFIFGSFQSKLILFLLLSVLTTFAFPFARFRYQAKRIIQWLAIGRKRHSI